MQDGAIRQSGAPLDLYDARADSFVASFIGSPSMNFFDGRVNGGTFEAASGHHFPLPAGGRALEGRAITYGVRPEQLAIHPEGVPARVTLVEPTGSELQVFADVGGVDTVLVLRERLTIRPGDRIRVMPSPDHVHLDTSGNRVG